jgi:hypothetical protein
MMDELPRRDVPSSQQAPGPPVQSDDEAAAPALTRHEFDAAAASLRGRAFLYDDPDAYAAGVRDTLSQLDAQLDAGSGSPAPAAEK